MPDGEKRKKRNESVKKSSSNSESFSRGQQLSDKLATQVARGKMTYDQARKRQASEDRANTKIKVGTKVRGSSQGLPSKRKYTKARHKLDRHGNKVAY